MARYTALQLLGTLFLVMSTSRIVVVAQQVTLNQAAPNSNATAARAAAILSSVLQDVGSNFAALAGGATVSAAPVGVLVTPTTSTPTASQTAASNVTLDPSIVKLLNQSMANGVSPSVITAIQKALLQQQQAGSDLGTLEGAARTVASFLSLPATLGTGANIRDFTARIDQLRALRDSVRTFLGTAELATITNYLLTAAQLGLQFVAAFPLAQLAYLTALIALGAAITGLIAGIFYTVGSALAIAASVPAVAAIGTGDAGTGTTTGNGAAIDTRDGNESSASSASSASGSLIKDPLVRDIQMKAMAIYKPIVSWALSSNAMGGLKLVDGLLGAVSSGMGTFSGIASVVG
ncbi:hypothetical protein V8C86DRAFT_3133361 [Haematococcus lacustris]